jgi:hypothetical protein
MYSAKLLSTTSPNMAEVINKIGIHNWDCFTFSKSNINVVAIKIKLNYSSMLNLPVFQKYSIVTVLNRKLTTIR